MMPIPNVHIHAYCSVIKTIKDSTTKYVNPIKEITTLTWK